jgi:hypothetical protein
MDIGEQSLAAEFAVVDEAVGAHASEFAARGLILRNLAEGGTPPFVRSIRFHFSNARAGLRLSVSFFVGRSGARRGFTAMIEKTGHGSLDVGDYLEHHGRSDMARLLIHDGPTDVRAFAESSLRMLLGLLDDELKPIVEGETFEETPIDWQGYK